MHKLRSRLLRGFEAVAAAFRRGGWPRTVGAAVTAGAVVLVGFVLLAPLPGPAPHTSTAPSSPAHLPNANSTSARTPPPATPTKGRVADVGGARPGIPQSLLIPRLHVDAPVRRIAMSTNPDDRDYRTLVPPSNPADVGWWQDGPPPGASRGSALIVGHTKRIPGLAGVGDGALGHISRLRVGDQIDLTTATSRLHYQVNSVVPAKPFGDVARDAHTIDDRNYPGGRLVLITCWFNGTQFIGNTLVFAVPR